MENHGGMGLKSRQRGMRRLTAPAPRDDVGESASAHVSSRSATELAKRVLARKGLANWLAFQRLFQVCRSVL